MNLSLEKINKIQHLIDKVCLNNIDNDFLTKNTSLICDILNSHYFAIIMFPNKDSNQSIFFSNNLANFNSCSKRDLQLIDKNILMDVFLKQNNIVKYNNVVKMDNFGKKEFFGELQGTLPISDCIYVPIKNNNRICGLTVIARKNSKNSIYNSNDVEIFQFISHFINEGFIRSLKLSSTSENKAIIDYTGNIISAGNKLKDLFIAMFGRKHWKTPFGRKSEMSNLLKRAYKKYTGEIIHPRRSVVLLNFNNKYYILEFKKIKLSFFYSYNKEAPHIELTLKDDIIKGETILDLEKAKIKFKFTPREIQIIDCIYKGFNNRDISIQLNICESTVKNHIWNIFNKVGVDNRTSLIFTLN